MNHYKRPIAIMFLILSFVTFTGCNKYIPDFKSTEKETVIPKEDIQKVWSNLNDFSQNTFDFAEKTSIMYIGNGSLILDSTYIRHTELSGIYVYQRSKFSSFDEKSENKYETIKYIIDTNSNKKSTEKEIIEYDGTELQLLDITRNLPDINKYTLSEDEYYYIFTLIDDNYFETNGKIFSIILGGEYKGCISTLYVEKGTMNLTKKETTYKYEVNNQPVYYIESAQFANIK